MISVAAENQSDVPAEVLSDYAEDSWNDPAAEDYLKPFYAQGSYNREVDFSTVYVELDFWRDVV